MGLIIILLSATEKEKKEKSEFELCSCFVFLSLFFHLAFGISFVVIQFNSKTLIIPQGAVVVVFCVCCCVCVGGGAHAPNLCRSNCQISVESESDWEKSGILWFKMPSILLLDLPIGRVKLDVLFEVKLIKSKFSVHNCQLQHGLEQKTPNSKPAQTRPHRRRPDLLIQEEQCQTMILPVTAGWLSVALPPQKP